MERHAVTHDPDERPEEAPFDEPVENPPEDPNPSRNPSPEETPRRPLGPGPSGFPPEFRTSGRSAPDRPPC